MAGAGLKHLRQNLGRQGGAKGTLEFSETGPESIENQFAVVAIGPLTIFFIRRLVERDLGAVRQRDFRPWQFTTGKLAENIVRLAKHGSGFRQYAFRLHPQRVWPGAQNIAEEEAEAFLEFWRLMFEGVHLLGPDRQNLRREPGGFRLQQRIEGAGGLCAFLISRDFHIFIGLQHGINGQPVQGFARIAETVEHRQHLSRTLAKCALVTLEVRNLLLQAIVFGTPGIGRRVEIAQIPHIGRIVRRIGGRARCGRCRLRRNRNRNRKRGQTRLQ